MKINGVFLSIAVATLLIESRVNLLAQEVPNDVTIKQQRIQKLKELRQSDELALRSKIHPDIRQKIASGENVLVIVHLDVLLKRITNPTQADDLVSKNLIVLAQEELLSALGQRRYKIMRRYENFPLIALEIGSDALDVLDTSPLVLRVQESRMNKAALNQSVPLVGAPQVWAPPTSINGSGWTVAIIDSGVSHSHPFLQDNNATIVVTDEACYSVTLECPGGVSTLIGQNAAVPCTFATGGCRHGTQVAGVVASRDTTYTGVAPGVNILAVNAASRATGASCMGDPHNDNPCVRYNDLDIIAGLDWIYTMRNTYSIAAVNISIQNSLVADQQSCDSLYSTYKTSIDRLRNVGIGTIIASGNQDQPNQPYAIAYPACVSSAVSVGATTGSGSGEGVASFSNSAPFLSLLAPGDGITTSGPETSPFTAIVSGTSFAAPHVAGAFALLKEAHSTASVAQILNALQTTGKKITDTRAGALNQVNCRIQIDQAFAFFPAPIASVAIDQSVFYGINNCGQIVGTEYVNYSGFIADTSGLYTSVVYNGPIEPGGFYDSTEATAINNRGEVHGYYCCGYYADHGYFRSSSGSISEVDSPNTNDIYGNNDTSDLVGYYWDGPPGHSAPFKYVNGALTALSSRPFDINNMTRIVGWHGPGASVMGENSVETTFDYPGAMRAYAFGINEAGQIVGAYWDSGFGQHGFYRDAAGTLTAIDIPGAAGTVASGINDSGQIVGYYWDDSDNYFGFVWLLW